MAETEKPDQAEDEPLVSVVIATYNRWPLISEAVASVLGQSHRDVEVVVVDDGSQDGTADRLADAFADRRLRIIRQENMERCAAFNRGMAAARGRYIGVLGSDDLYMPWTVEQFDRARRESPNIQVFGSRVWLWDPSTNRQRLLDDFDPRTLWPDCLKGAILAPQGMIVSRDAMLAVGCYPEQRSVAGSEDWILLMKLAHRYEVRKLARPAARIRQHPGRSMAQLVKINESRDAAARLILEEKLLGFEVDEASRRTIMAGTHRLCASHLYAAGQMAEARARLRELKNTVGWRRAVPWAGKLWLQTWLGTALSQRLRRAKDSVVWR